MKPHERDTFELEANGTINPDNLSKIRYLLIELQPAKEVVFVGEPPRVIKVTAYSADEIAPGLMKRLEELGGVTFTKR